MGQYTIEDLEKMGVDYKLNDKQIEELSEEEIGSEKHKELQKQREILLHLERKIKKDLGGTYAESLKSPCPLTRYFPKKPSTCKKCTGKYKVITRRMTIMTKGIDKKVRECEYKNIKLSDFLRD